jgi:23S rRNA (guanosine2251-2'-O)-methyltransferase
MKIELSKIVSPAIALVNVRSVHNAASIFRTADGAGFRSVVLLGHTPEPFNKMGVVRSDFAKVSLGAEDIPYAHKPSILSSLKKIKSTGFKVVALEQSKASVSYKKIKASKKEKIIIVVGSETEGLNKKILTICDEVAEIPMRANKESLNVAVSAGVMMYHIGDQIYKK